MKTREYARVLRAACLLALLALGLMVWSLFEPTPMPVLVAMSMGQALGTVSLLMFGAVVLADIRRSRLDRQPVSSVPPPLNDRSP